MECFHFSIYNSIRPQLEMSSNLQRHIF
jgi:hypothetical protein